MRGLLKMRTRVWLASPAHPGAGARLAHFPGGLLADGRLLACSKLLAPSRCRCDKRGATNKVSGASLGVRHRIPFDPDDHLLLRGDGDRLFGALRVGLWRG